jgi:hypothetical protein
MSWETMLNVCLDEESDTADATDLMAIDKERI